MEKAVTIRLAPFGISLVYTLLLLLLPLSLFAQTSENQFTVKTKIVEEKEQEAVPLSVLKEQSGEAEVAEEEEPLENEAAEVESNEAAVENTSLGIAEEHLPPPGNCRVWYIDRPVEEQPKVLPNCERIQKRMPRGAILLYRPLVNSQFVEVCHFDESNPGIVKMVRFYLAATGELQREEKF